MSRRTFVPIVLLAVVITALAAAAATAPSIKWVYNYNKALATAKRVKKPVMIDFYTDWCGWCKRLDKDTYADKKVVALSSKFVCAKINAEKDTDAAEPYNIEGYPTIIFLNSAGKEIHRVVGYKDAKGFLVEMNKALKKSK